jgi:hypothetical protein
MFQSSTSSFYSGSLILLSNFVPDSLFLIMIDGQFLNAKKLAILTIASFHYLMLQLHSVAGKPLFPFPQLLCLLKYQKSSRHLR